MARDKRAITIALGNEKGGVGKTTTAGALGAALSKRGYKVLLIDLDPQGNLTYSLGGHESPGASSYELITRTKSTAELTQHVGALDLIPANRTLAEADTVLTMTGREYRLKEALEPLQSVYDFIIIDNRPALGVLTINSLTAADVLIIPAQANIFSLQGIGQLAAVVEGVKKYTNPGLTVLGILLTRYNERTILSRDLTQLIQDIAQAFNTRVFDTRIRQSIAIEEAQASKASLFDYDPNGKGTDDYRAFTDEVLALLNHDKGR